VEKSGSWYSFRGDRIGQGRENAKQFLKANPDVRDRIDAELRTALGLTKGAEAEPVVAAVENGKPAGSRK
jgi:recombination protein RecA